MERKIFIVNTSIKDHKIVTLLLMKFEEIINKFCLYTWPLSSYGKQVNRYDRK